MTSEIVACNLNAMHAAHQAFIKSESAEKLRRALCHQTRTYSDVKYFTGNIVYYKRNNSNEWKGSGTVIGQDGQQVLVKHGGSYVRVHPSHLLLEQVAFGQPMVDGQGEEEAIRVQQVASQTDKNFESDEDEKVESADLLNEQVMELENEGLDHLMNQQSNEQNNEDLRLLENETETSVGMKQDSNQVTEDSEQSQAQNKIIFSRQSIPKVKTYLEYQTPNSSEWAKVQVISRAGKVTGKYRNHFNIRNITNNSISCVDWDKDIHRWKYVENNEEVLVGEHMIDDCEVLDAKLEELGEWKANKVYEPVPFTGKKHISTRWVLTDKIIGGERKIKARLVARGFEEKNEELMKDSPTCARESLRLIFAIMVTKKWKIHSIDIKAAFLQGRPIDRKVYLPPPVEAEVENTIWELKTCIYGLGDASRSCYLSVREQLTKLKGMIQQFSIGILMFS